MRSSLLFPVGLLAVAALPASAGDAAPVADDTFTLGQIVVTARRPEGIAIGESTLSSGAMYSFNRNALDEAVNLMPGVSSSNSGGSRNERLLFVRGFDRFQVPLSLDGIRVYLPADNRLDYGRFLTPDISEVQVAKGHASVLDGPGAMGGAVNLVTRKPTRALEVEARGSLAAGSGAEYGGYNAFALVGTRRDQWYAQGSYTRNLQDHWDLSGDYRPTTASSEDGGERDFSATRDSRLNAKFGFTPNDTDEYSISYTRQAGEKNAPLHVTDPVATQRNWSWPYWNIDSLYFLSITTFGERFTLRTRLYGNSFDNLLRSFDNRTETTQTLARAFNSYYADRARGGSAQLDLRLTAADQLSLAAHYRRDEHVEWQQGFPTGFTEPPQTNLESTFSVAAKNRLAFSPRLTFVAGASYDWRDLKRAEEYGTPPTGGAARVFNYPLRNSKALNGQGQLLWALGGESSLHASVSSRTRFPTIFERFSTQFGTAASNPDLRPERATNYEVGGSRLFGIVRVEGAVFYSDIHDAIVAVRPAGFPANSTQRQNLGSATYYGAELSLSARLATKLELGANYTYIHRSLSIGTPAAGTIVPVFQLTDVPTQKGLLYASWSPLASLQLLPSVEFASNRTTVTTAAPAVYYDTGCYVLTDGFPEPGRSYSASLRLRF